VLLEKMLDGGSSWTKNISLNLPISLFFKQGYKGYDIQIDSVPVNTPKKKKKPPLRYCAEMHPRPRYSIVPSHLVRRLVVGLTTLGTF
jgi:hypothetical protein